MRISSVYRLASILTLSAVVVCAITNPSDYGFGTLKSMCGLLTMWVLDLLADVKDIRDQVAGLHKRYSK